MNEGSSIVVLLVDDQPIVGEAIRRALVDAPEISLHYCDDPDRAVESAERIRPAVILQDLVMPGVDGLTLVRRYRATPSLVDVPIIVLSTKEEPAVKSEAFASGANDYLVKLPDRIELIARLRHHARAYLNALQRDEAYRALRQSQALLQQQNIELERLSNVDGLTGLSNRRYFDDFTALQWRVAIRENKDFAILMIDVDDFKRYNDTYGHLAGDLVLKRVAEAIKSCCGRPSDLVARFGGEEFVASVFGSAEGVAALAEELRCAVECLQISHVHSQAAGVLTVSIGAASMQPHNGQEYLPLVEAADIALYEAKHSGKNRVVVRILQHAEP